MPLHLGNLTRREFLCGTLVGAGALALPASALASPGGDPHRVALFSDTHISENPAETNGGINMTAHLRQALSEVLALERPPSSLLVNGDCAYLRGLSGDYSNFVDLLRPAHEGRIPVHCVLGNHDHRENFRTGVMEAGAKETLAGKHVCVIKMERANLFLLDSLDKTNVTPGLLGQEQLTWLRRALDTHSERPAIVFVHHQPNCAEFGTVGGISDTQPLFDILVPRTHVKALFFGHTHHWLIGQREGIHCVNLPPVAYVFNPADPSGWVDLQIREYGATTRMNSLDLQHKAHGEEHKLSWR